MHEQYDISEILSITVCSVYWWQLNTGIVDQFGMATPTSAIHGQWSQFQTFRVAKVILLLVTQWGGTVLGSASALVTAVIFLHKIKHLSNEKEFSTQKLICEEVEMCEVKSLQ